MEVSRISQFSAMAANTANSTALRFSTGKAPGSPRQTGQTFVLGGSPNRVEHEQKIFVTVRSCTCTSSPLTGSYLARAAIDDSAAVTILSDYKTRAATHGLPGSIYLLLGSLRYFSSGTSRYINSFPFASRTPVR